MRIAIVGWGMPMGPNALDNEGLGGSETAQLLVGEALAALGCEVVQFTNLNHDWKRENIYKGVTWRHVYELKTMDAEEFDIAIVCRRPDLLEGIDKLVATHRVLWVQDFAAAPYPHNYMKEMDLYSEIWCVSNWQARQWRAELSEVALPPIWVTRNGIKHCDAPNGRTTHRDYNQLAFISRPERGLMAMVQPGGILDFMPDHHLVVCGYTDFPSQNKEWYDLVFGLAEAHPRVKLIGSQPQYRVRQLLRESGAMVLPTNYAETSCMSALEAINALCPVLATAMNADARSTYGSGAVNETLNGAGVIIDAPTLTYCSAEWCQQWAKVAKGALRSERIMDHVRSRMLARTGMTWDNVAREWLTHMEQVL